MYYLPEKVVVLWLLGNGYGRIVAIQRPYRGRIEAFYRLYRGRIEAVSWPRRGHT